MMYIIQLYKIIVIDRAITRDNSNLVAFTIIDGSVCAPIHPVSISISYHHLITCLHTVSTSVPKSIIFSVLFAGSISCHNKSLAASEIHQKKKNNHKKVPTKYTIQVFNLLNLFIIFKSDQVKRQLLEPLAHEKLFQNPLFFLVAADMLMKHMFLRIFSLFLPA